MPFSRLFRFLVTSLIALVVLIIPWYYLSPCLAAPMMSVAGQLMDSGFRWVVGFERSGTVGTLLTNLNVMVNQNGRMVVAELSPEVNYRTFGYGLVLFWALLIASRPERMWFKMAMGTFILVPSQMFSVCFRWLREALLSNSAEVMRQAGVSRWMLKSSRVLTNWVFDHYTAGAGAALAGPGVRQQAVGGDGAGGRCGSDRT